MVSDERLPARVGPVVLGRVRDFGDDGGSRSGTLGEPESEPALKGWNETDGLLLDPSYALDAGRPAAPRIGREWGGSVGSTLSDMDSGGELVSEPIGRTDLRAVIGLVPRAPAPWNVDRLPYVCWGPWRPRSWRCDGKEPGST